MSDLGQTLQERLAELDAKADALQADYLAFEAQQHENHAAALAPIEAQLSAAKQDRDRLELALHDDLTRARETLAEEVGKLHAEQGELRLAQLRADANGG